MTQATVMQIDVTHEVNKAFEPQPAYIQRVQATKQGIMALLELLISDNYLREDSREQISANENYFLALNNGWLQPAGVRWSSGTRYMRHAITPRGRAVLQKLRDEMTCRALVIIHPDAQRCARYVARRIERQQESKRRAWDALYAEHTSEVQAQRYTGVI